MDNVVSAGVTASIANDVAKLPAGSAIVVDDLHTAASAVSKHMTDLVERWPAETTQQALASRLDPPLRRHRWRMSGELAELRDHELLFSLAESRVLLANFGVEVAAADLALLQQRSEGWAAPVQMEALSLRGTNDPVRVARALDVRSHAIAEYLISEALEQQLAEFAQFILDTSISGKLGGLVLVEAFTPSTVSALYNAVELLPIRRDEDRDRWLTEVNRSRSGWYLGGRRHLGVVRNTAALQLEETHQDGELPKDVDAVWMYLTYLTPSVAIVVATFAFTEEAGDLSALLRANYRMTSREQSPAVSVTGLHLPSPRRPSGRPAYSAAPASGCPIEVARLNLPVRAEGLSAARRITPGRVVPSTRTGVLVAAW